jgi:ferredoxin
MPSAATVEVPRGALLTDAIRAAGLPIATACGDELVCGRCGVRILRGKVAREKPVERAAKRRNRVPDDLRLACVIRVRGDLEVTADYWGPVPARRALILVDHGSRRAEAHAHAEWLAAQVRARRPDLAVHVAHLELAEPSIGQAVARAVAEGARELVIHPLLLVPGRHLGEDLPEQVRAATAGHAGLSVRITEPLGGQPGLADLILAALDA